MPELASPTRSKPAPVQRPSSWIATITAVISSWARRAARPRALAGSALSHALAGSGGLPIALVLGLALALAPVVACDGGASKAAAAALPPAEIARQLDELVVAVTPIDPAATSDKQDAWLIHQREVRERLRAAPAELGNAALERFSAQRDPLPVRAALLDVAAHCAPDAAAPVLEHSIRTYDGQAGLQLRTAAVELLAQTSPQRALALFEPFLRDAVPRATRPPQESFVRGWAIAARQLQLKDALVLSDLAVNLEQPIEARYAAVDELGKFGGQRALKALEEVLVEAASDGLMRRKAAQALAEVMPREQFCARITAISEHESDPNFIYFLDSLLQQYCAQ